MGLNVLSPEPPAHLVLEGVCILKLSLKGQPVSTLRWHLVGALLGPGRQVTAEWLSGCACMDFPAVGSVDPPRGGDSVEGAEEARGCDAGSIRADAGGGAPCREARVSGQE